MKPAGPPRRRGGKFAVSLTLPAWPEDNFANGADAIRTAYAAFFKANPRDPKLDQHDAVFSDDGTMGWDEGTFTGTVDGPGGKPMKISSDYLSVWKHDSGAWKIVREITNSNTTPTQ